MANAADDVGMLDATLRDLAAAASLDALSVLLPVACAGCARPDRGLCRECRAALTGPPVRRRLEGGLEVVAALPYDGVVRRSILAFKESGRTDLARALAVPLAAALDAALTTCSMEHPGMVGIRLCPVPPGANSQRRRGFDPVRLLARHAAARPIERMLRRETGATQKLLGVDERRANIAGTMSVRHSLEGVPVLLVDDVITSGATFEEAARAIVEAGGSLVGAVALAATPLRSATHRDAS